MPNDELKARVEVRKTTPNESPRLLPYWERVRLLYLELGGELLDGRRV